MKTGIQEQENTSSWTVGRSCKGHKENPDDLKESFELRLVLFVFYKSNIMLKFTLTLPSVPAISHQSFVFVFCFKNLFLVQKQEVTRV